jgi:hypothetical protein
MGIVKLKLSASSDGEPLNLATSSSGATTIHTFTASTGDNTYDEIYLWAFNNATASMNITLEYGSTTLTCVTTVYPKAGQTLLLPGLIGNTGLVLKGFKSTTGDARVIGFVNQITS